jgi:hypothetical protein
MEKSVDYCRAFNPYSVSTDTDPTMDKNSS